MSKNLEESITLTRVLWDVVVNSALAAAIVWVFVFAADESAIGIRGIHTGVVLTALVIVIVLCGTMLGLRVRKGMR
jgi:hypothetical protein